MIILKKSFLISVITFLVFEDQSLFSQLIVVLVPLLNQVFQNFHHLLLLCFYGSIEYAHNFPTSDLFMLRFLLLYNLLSSMCSCTAIIASNETVHNFLFLIRKSITIFNMISGMNMSFYGKYLEKILNMVGWMLLDVIFFEEKITMLLPTIYEPIQKAHPNRIF